MLKKAKGYRGRRSKLFRYAKDAVMKAQYRAYRDRKTRKRTFRYLWIQRLNAAARANGMTYSRLAEGMKLQASRWTAKFSPISPSLTKRHLNPSSIKRNPRWRRKRRKRHKAFHFFYRASAPLANFHWQPMRLPLQFFGVVTPHVQRSTFV